MIGTQERGVLAHAAAAPMLEQTLRWAAINSGSMNLPGLAQMASELVAAFGSLPGVPTLHEGAAGNGRANGASDAPLGRNLHLRVRPDAPAQLVLTGHMDTVFGVDHAFQTVVPGTPDGIVNGPGVADMKGGLAVMLAALKAFETSGLTSRLGYEVVINADEEIGSIGSAPLIAAAARGKHAALTYEPAQTPEGMFTSSRPGSGNFRLVVTGRSAHAGRNPQDGRNAMVAAADLALRLADAKRDGLAINPARIEGGGPNNVVPDHAVLHVNIRPRTPTDEDDARVVLADVIAGVGTRHDVSIGLHGSFTRPPKPMTPQAEWLYSLVRDCGAELGLAVNWQPSGGVCDGNNIAACGVPVIDTMGVRGGAIHSDREYLIVESLAERARLSALLLMRCAQYGL